MTLSYAVMFYLIGDRTIYSNPKLFVASASLSQRELMAERSQSLYQLILDCYII
jgi:hypothetical protein